MAGIIKKLFGGRDKRRDDLTGEVRKSVAQYDSTKRFWGGFLDRGEESVEMFGGNQWSAEDLGKYQNNNRPVVTINLIAALVRQVTGMRTNERLQPRVLPEREGTVQMADIYTKLIYFILKKNNYQAVNFKVQQDQVVAGRGFWEVDTSFENNPEGELTIRHIGWNECLPDPISEHPYFDDARFIFRSKLMPRDAIIKHFGAVGENLVSDEPENLQWTDDDDLRDKNIHEDFVDSQGMYLVLEKLSLVKTKKWMVTDGKNWTEYDQQISPEVIRKVGKENIIVIATSQKLATLRARALRVDTGDPVLDEELKGYYKVVTGYRRRTLYKAE